jgi:hypothetical protein
VSALPASIPQLLPYFLNSRFETANNCGRDLESIGQQSSYLLSPVEEAREFHPKIWHPGILMTLSSRPLDTSRWWKTFYFDIILFT